jgi:hypothetical protein
MNVKETGLSLKLGFLAYHTSNPGLSLGAGDRRNSPPIPPLIAGYIKKKKITFFCLLHQWIVLNLSIKL